MNSARIRLIVVAATFLLVVLPLCAAFLPPAVIWDLLFGWFLFLVNAWPRVDVDGVAIVVGAIAAVLLTLGTHFMLRWWVLATASPDASDRLRRWRFHWSLGWVGIVLVTFSAGISVIGAMHQVMWTLASPNQLTHRVENPYFGLDSRMRQVSLSIMSAEAATSHSLRVENRWNRDDAPLSWITAMAPYWGVSLRGLHSEKPWDDPANAEAFGHLFPEVMYPGYDISTWRDSRGYGLSHLAANVHIIEKPGPGLTVEDDDKGKSNTLLIGQIPTEFEPWGKPGHARNPDLGLNTSPSGFGSIPDQGTTIFLMADGSVRHIRNDIDAKTFARLGKPGVRPD